MGRRAKPVELMLLRGKTHLTKQEIRQRREAEAAIRPPADAVKPPSWLDPAARRVWKRVAPPLLELQLVTNVDIDALANYCDAVARYAECARAIREQGIIINSAMGGRVQNPAVLAAQKYAQLIRAFASEFGLTPSARAKLALPKGDDKPKDKFEELFGS